MQSTTRKEGMTISWSNMVKVVNVMNEPSPRSNFILKSILTGGRSTHDKKSHKVILNEVTGEALPGEVLGIMGPSGAGKTTLLNVLAKRSTFDAGTFKLDNGVGNQAYKQNMAYITQKDVFFKHLTVRDQLLYTAYLRVSGSKEAKVQEVNHMIEMLRLQKCQNTQIKNLSGGEQKRLNIGTELLTDPSVILLDEPTSGLDSTSAVALLHTLREDLALKYNKTIITSIHQPSSFTFFQTLDKVLFLADGGYVVYHGTPKDSLMYLKQINMPCPEGYSAADHWMDLLVESGNNQMNNSSHNHDKETVLDESPPREMNNVPQEHIDDNHNENKDHNGETVEKDNIEEEETGLKLPSISSYEFSVKREKKKLRHRDNAMELAKIERKNCFIRLGTKSAQAILISSWKKVEEDNSKHLELKTSTSKDVSNQSDHQVSSECVSFSQSRTKFSTSWWRQYKILSHRAFRNSSDAILTPLNIIKSVLKGLIAGLMWFQMEHTERYINDRSSYFFFTMTFWVFSAMYGAIFTFPMERSIILKERASGSYHLSAYFLAKTTSEAPTLLALPTIYMTLSYWMANVNSSFLLFLGSTGCALLSVLAGESLGLLCGALVMNFQRAMTLMTVIGFLLSLAGGFYIEHVPSFISWAKYLSPFKYAFDASRLMVFNSNITCDGSEIICLTPEKDFVTIDEVKEHLKIEGSLAFNAGMLFVIFLVPRYFALLALQQKERHKRS